jgi:hypothetical protein
MQLGLHLQSKKYWFGVASAPYLPLKGQKAPKIYKIGIMRLKMDNIRLYLVSTTKI